MAMKQQINLKQSQRLTMTPHLRQAIEILQLNHIDLRKFLEEEVEKNPLLKLRKPLRNSTVSVRGQQTGYDPVDLISAEHSLLQHLSDQISLINASDQTRQLAMNLIGELDENGYLSAPLFELSDRLKVPTHRIEEALEIVQACDPAGIGARDLRECLKLQLIDRNRFDPVMEQVLKNLPLVAKNDICAIASLIGEDGPEVREILKEIRQLNPRPASEFSHSPVLETRPDIIVKQGEMGVWRVELIASALPRVLVNHEYAAEIASKSHAAEIFAHDCEQSANWLVQALDQRAQTILKAATAIVQHQHRFFTEGPTAMLPLNLAQIADSVKVHESTISRVINGKYLICDRGIFELKYFFASKIASLDGKRDYSSMEIRGRIKDLIDEENHKKPASDDRIINILRSDGVDIARRTVAKYRKAMSIPSSVIRRKINSQN